MTMKRTDKGLEHQVGALGKSYSGSVPVQKELEEHKRFYEAMVQIDQAILSSADVATMLDDAFGLNRRG